MIIHRKQPIHIYIYIYRNKLTNTQGPNHVIYILMLTRTPAAFSNQRVEI